VSIRFFLLAAALALCFAALPADAIIDATLQMQLGNPSGATSDTNNHDHYLIQRTVEALDYSDNLGEPNWASWDLTGSDIGSSGRSGSFFTDTNLPTDFYWVTTDDYNGVGAINYNRGHMCPSADRTANTTDNDMVFFMSNIIPQAAQNNQGVWGNFESYCQGLAQSGDELLITCGPSLFNGTLIPSGKAAIATYTWKIAVIVPPGSGTALSRITTNTQVVSIRIPNSNNVTSAWQSYVTSVNQIQVDTGFTFFTALPPDVAAVLRNEVYGQSAPPPDITGFSPTNGAANASVVITGSNFTSASVVAFNGTGATFNVDSATQITAVVPTFATTGEISVTTPGGTAFSSSNFTVTGTFIDLAITATHSSIFTQGGAGNFTIVVTNVGTLASSGTVTVTDTLPPSLTATVLSGSGWTPNLGTLTCTRSDALAPGASYPPITLTVSVASNAPANVTNMAALSGGSDTNAANNSASDPTTINPSGGGGGSNTVTLIGWDVNGLTTYGPSPLSPTTTAPNLTTVGLTRGSGVGTSGTAAARAWGGNTFTGASSAAAIAANEFATFSLAATSGYLLSCTSVSTFDYRHSSTGPANGLLQYQIGSGAFNDIATISYSVNTSGGAALSPIDLSGISALQNITSGSNITFRIVNWGGTSSGGTWYIYDVANSTALDFAVQGTLTAPTPIQSWRLQWFGTVANSGAAADTAIASSDGMPNLLKYAYGLDPLVATNDPLVADITTGYLRLTLPKNPNATDVTFQVQVTGDLTQPWTTNGTTIDQNTATLLQVHDTTPVNTAVGGRFMRLQVSGQ
jgi:DNA/RNA endonuclease G (NUC1)